VDCYAPTARIRVLSLGKRSTFRMTTRKLGLQRYPKRFRHSHYALAISVRLLCLHQVINIRKVNIPVIFLAAFSNVSRAELLKFVECPDMHHP
jgi:hypothetical protein